MGIMHYTITANTVIIALYYYNYRVSMITHTKTIALAILSALALSACVTSPSGLNSNTALINAPSTIIFADKSYQQANYVPKQVGKISTESYEYTADNDTLEDWRTLITLTHVSFDAEPEAVLENLGRTLENTNPKPIYEVTYIEESNWGVARIIYPPSETYDEYESNNWLIDFNLNCKGHNTFQFAQHYPADVALEAVIENNQKMAIYLVTNPQHFTCK